MEYIIRDKNGDDILDSETANYFIDRKGKVIQVTWNAEDTALDEVENAVAVPQIAYHDLLKEEINRCLREYEEKYYKMNDVRLEYELRFGLRPIKEGEYTNEASLTLEVNEVGRRRVVCRRTLGFTHQNQLKNELMWKAILYRGMLYELIASGLAFDDMNYRYKQSSEKERDKAFRKTGDINTGYPEGKMLLALLAELAETRGISIEECLAQVERRKQSIYRER